MQVSKSSIRRWVREAATEVAAEAERPERWDALPSHDLRRSWATHHLVERGQNIRTMMPIGRWSDYSAIEPYLK